MPVYMNGSTIRAEHELSDVVRPVDWKEQEYLRGSERERRSFSGLKDRDPLEAVYAWTEGACMVERAAVALTGAARSIRVWNEEDGDYFSVDRAREGLPPLHKRIRTSGANTGRIKTILVNVAENCFIGAEQMIWKAATAAALVDSLESAGYRVEVIAVIDCRNLSTQGHAYVMTVPVKSAEEPSNLAALAGILSPWFFRIHGFNRMVDDCKIVGRRADESLGTSRPITIGKEYESPIIIDNGACLSESASKQFLKTLE